MMHPLTKEAVETKLRYFLDGCSFIDQLPDASYMHVLLSASRLVVVFH